MGCLRFWSGARVPSSLGISIPCFNDAATIRQTLNSLVNQCRKPRAVYVVDDASSDSTLSIVREFESILPIEIHGHETNLGLVGNWNRCIKVSNQDFLWILHSDDWLHPSAVAFVLDMIDSDCCDILSTGAVMLPSPDAGFAIEWENRKMEPTWSHIYTGTSGFVQSLSFICSEVVVRRSFYEEFGLFSRDFPYSPDEELWPRLALQGRLAKFIGGALTAVRTSGEHEMHRTWRKPDFTDQWNSLHRRLQEMSVGLPSADALDVSEIIEGKRRQGLEWVRQYSCVDAGEDLSILNKIRKLIGLLK